MWVAGLTPPKEKISFLALRSFLLISGISFVISIGLHTQDGLQDRSTLVEQGARKVHGVDICPPVLQDSDPGEVKAQG